MDRVPVLAGTLDETDLEGLVEMMTLFRQLSTVELESPAGAPEGTLWMKSGQVIDVIAGDLTGLDAVRYLVGRPGSYTVYRIEGVIDPTTQPLMRGTELLQVISELKTDSARLQHSTGLQRRGALPDESATVVSAAATAALVEPADASARQAAPSVDASAATSQPQSGDAAEQPPEHTTPLDTVSAPRLRDGSPPDSAETEPASLTALPAAVPPPPRAPSTPAPAPPAARAPSTPAPAPLPAPAPMRMPPPLTPAPGRAFAPSPPAAPPPAAPRAAAAPAPPPVPAAAGPRWATPAAPPPPAARPAPVALRAGPPAPGPARAPSAELEHSASGPHGPILAVFANKGGVGKTTIAVNLSVALVRRGLEVVLVDADPRNDVGNALAARKDTSRGLYDVLDGTVALADVLLPTALPGFAILPAGGLNLPEDVFARVSAQPERIAALLLALARPNTIVVVDSPAGLRGVSYSVLSASTHALAVVQAEPLAVRSAALVPRVLDGIPANHRPALAGVVLNMFDRRVAASLAVLDGACEIFGAEAVYDIPIPRAGVFIEASANGAPVALMDGSGGTTAGFIFESLASHVLARLGLSTPKLSDLRLL
ncbi:MAG: AAA family ATPase [Polyangiaceae bacterium]|nr:AAA family ATPase [Polyangiaceae bacterium]